MGEKQREGAVAFLEEITPSHLRCGIASCPGVYATDNDDLVVIGKRLSEGLAAQIGHRVGEDEYAIVIGREFFQNLNKTR
jgi:hypothetical protein